MTPVPQPDRSAARDFLYRSARLLEQRVHEALFGDAERDAAVASVVTAVAAYRNDDGGFGHALEPDKRSPASQPLDVEIAFERLAMVGAAGPGVDALTGPACDWLRRVADPSGAVPILLPSVGDQARAAHWTPTEYSPSLNPTAAIVAHAHTLGVTHPWLDAATEYCFVELESGRLPDVAHYLLGLTKFVAVAPDRERAAAATAAIGPAIHGASFLRLNPTDEAYGLTPLDFAHSPGSVARRFFDDGLIEAHLDHLVAEQQPDGGWPISWDPPPGAATNEWRGIRTLEALRILDAYGR